MITSIKVRNYKGIHRIPRIGLDPFQVLVGPNGSGKSTFLDVFEFIKDCLVADPRSAVERRVPEFRDLTYGRRGGLMEFELGLKLDLTPGEQSRPLMYRLELAADDRRGVVVKSEILLRSAGKNELRLLGKTTPGKDFYRRESGTYTDSFDFGREKLALSQTPSDLQRYPTANAVKSFLLGGIRPIQLNSIAMRQPAAATRPIELELDGTNLPRVVGHLLRSKGGGNSTAGRDAVDRWVSHLRYALEDLEGIDWRRRPPDNAEYLVLKFVGGLECPNWLMSDGTLRMLALTLPAFLTGASRLYTVEEPENGVHPQALEIIIKALAAIPAAQVFLATHSPLVVQHVGADPLLCFTCSPATGVAVLHGAKHPALANWTGTPDLGTIFASRVFG